MQTLVKKKFKYNMTKRFLILFFFSSYINVFVQKKKTGRERVCAYIFGGGIMYSLHIYFISGVVDSFLFFFPTLEMEIFSCLLEFISMSEIYCFWIC